jgi:excisionase family DNA binding protein
MPAYATRGAQLDRWPASANAQAEATEGDQFFESLISHLADRVTAAVVARLGRPEAGSEAEWLDSRHAADYLGLHRDTLRKLAAARTIPSEQDGPRCKLYFRRSDLDAWRAGGGRPRHLAVVAERTA